MNFSRNVSLLKTIDATLDDKIYLGVTESKAILSTIDNSLTTIDSVLDNIYSDTTSANSHLSNIATSSSNADTSLNAIELSASNIDTSLNNVESDIDAVNSKLIDIGVTLAANDRFSVDQEYQQLKDPNNSNARQLDSGDYATTSGKLVYENNNGADILVKKVVCSFQSSETTWDKLFTSTASATNSNLKLGIGDDNTGIDSTKVKFSNNREIQPFMSMVFADPAGGDEMYYSYQIDDLNIKVADGEFFIAELKGTYNASGDDSFSAGIFYEKSV